MNVGHRLVCHCTIWTLLLAMLVAMPLFAEDAPAKKKWTFMLYMAADNNLEGSADADLNELETVGSSDQVNIVVQLDRIGRYSQDSEFKWPEAKRFYVKKDANLKKFSSPVMQELGEVDMAAPGTLLDFVSWAAHTYPAERYALIFWNHGTGWKEISPQIMAAYDTVDTSRRPGLSPSMEAALNTISYNISYDDTSASSMDIPSLGATIARIPGIIGQPLDLLGFDACLMQMLEVAYEVGEHARYQVGAPDLEPDRGWPYDAIMQKLVAAPTMDGRKLGQTIVSTYKASYEAGTQGNTSVVLSLIDLSKVKGFTSALEGLARALKEGIQEIDSIDQAREEALKYVYKDYADLGHFIQLLSVKLKGAAIRSSLAELKTYLQGSVDERLVISCARTGEKYKNSHGLAVFLPDREGFRTYKNRYKLLAMSKENGWFKFLQEYEAPGFPYICIQDILLEDENRDGRFAPGELVTVGLQLKNLGTKPATKAHVTLDSASEYLEETKFAINLTELPAPRKEKIVSVFKFRIKPDAPLNQPVALSASLSGPQIPLSTAHTTFYLKS
ncbi:MAG TPA: clostripain-related cysteine peptidase, partial [Candidatus Ozemobacteraceae bacterium]|nr:clostripain-related cysteine peptidase [Candidatus Ozemobacteraceae bacterium]